MPNRTVRRKPQVKGAGYTRNGPKDGMVHIRYGPVYGDRKKVLPKRRRAPNAAERQRINIVNQINLHFERALGGEFMPRRPGGFGPGGLGAPPQTPPYQPPAHYPRPGGEPPPNGPPPDVLPEDAAPAGPGAPPDVPPSPANPQGAAKPASDPGSSPDVSPPPDSPHPPPGGAPYGVPQAHLDAANAQLAERDALLARAAAASGEQRAQYAHDAAVLGQIHQASMARIAELQAMNDQHQAAAAQAAMASAAAAQARSQQDAATQARMDQQQKDLDAVRAEADAQRARGDTLEGQARAAAMEAAAREDQRAKKIESRIARESQARYEGYVARMGDDVGSSAPAAAPVAPQPQPAAPVAPPQAAVPDPGGPSQPAPMELEGPVQPPSPVASAAAPADSDGPQPMSPDVRRGPNVNFSGDILDSEIRDWSGGRSLAPSPESSRAASVGQPSLHLSLSDVSDSNGSWSPMGSNNGSWGIPGNSGGSTEIIPEGSATEIVPEGSATQIVSDGSGSGVVSQGSATQLISEHSGTQLISEHSGTQIVSDASGSGVVSQGSLGTAAAAEALAGLHEAAQGGAALHRLKRGLSRENSNDAQGADRAMPLPRYGSDVAGPSAMAREDSDAFRSASEQSLHSNRSFLGSVGSWESAPRGRDAAYDRLFQPSVVAMEPHGSGSSAGGSLPSIPSGSFASTVSHPSRLFSFDSDYSSVHYGSGEMPATSDGHAQYDGGFFSPSVPDQ